MPGWARRMFAAEYYLELDTWFVLVAEFGRTHATQIAADPIMGGDDFVAWPGTPRPRGRG